MSVLARILNLPIFQHRLLRRYAALVREDLSATYSRDIQKWLVVAPIIGVATGLVITGITKLILGTIWEALLPIYLSHHWLILPGLLIGFLLTGLIMQYRTRDPDLHSTEEIIRSYHEHQGDIDFQPFWWKLIAAVTTVGSGGSAALEGPSIYGGGAIGSWLWVKLRRVARLESRDRRIMLISGAAAGMAAVFRAPLTGIVFALEMPYKDDLAHEALLPSLIASVVAYATLISFVGATPLFGFTAQSVFHSSDVIWSALLGAGIGLIAIVFDITFRRARTFSVHARVPHTVKLLIGGLGTAICGLLFISIFPGKLIPLGPNYEAVRYVLGTSRFPSTTLVSFAVLKLIATIFSLGSGGVSAMFVPLLLSGGCLGAAFAQSVLHSPAVDMYAAVGMAALIAAGYKTPLTAVVFIAEVTGGHAFIIPSLIGAAVGYAISGEASVSGDQHLHETVRIAELRNLLVRDVMQPRIVSVPASTTLEDFARTTTTRHNHISFPVREGNQIVGLISSAALGQVAPSEWKRTTVGAVARRDVTRVAEDCDLSEALRLLVREDGGRMLLVTRDHGGEVSGIITKTDILRVVPTANPAMAPNNHHSG